MKQSWFVYPIRVRYQETDQMGVVFYGNYVTWFEIGRTEWIRNLGYSYSDIEKEGLLLPVVDLYAKYHSPAKYDDTVIICTRVKEMTPLRIEFESEVRKVSGDMFQAASYQATDSLPGQLLVSGGTKHVWVNEQFQPTRLAKAIPALYDALLSF